MANTYLTRTIGTPTLNTKYTISFWIKKGSIGDIFVIDGRDDASNRFKIAFGTTGTIECFNYHSGSPTIEFTTNRVFTDPSAFYHMLLAVDTTDGTAGDRFKFYVNGVRETSFSSSTNPSLSDANNVINESGNTVTIGAYNSGSGNTYYFDGVLSHFYFIDGTAYAPTVFGETDATTGEWKINTSPSITMGTNGFTILKDGNTITDQSSNSNDFTLGGGTLTNTEDNPSNVFATFNPLIPQGLAYANGNLSATHNAASWKTAYGTLAMSGTGKYYFESKVSTLGSYQGVGIVDVEQATSTAGKFVAQSRGYGYKTTGEKTNNDIDASYGGTYTTGDIIMTAVDLNAGAIWFGKNGTWLNSATQSEIEAGTTTNAAFTSISNSYVYYPAVQIYGSGTNQTNFGNGYFGTTAISSEGTNASGIGKFEYDVPTGYTALSTKGLNL